VTLRIFIWLFVLGSMLVLGIQGYTKGCGVSKNYCRGRHLQ
jgi:hypothetical protein